MIKTFLLNIINNVVHLNVAESSLKLYRVGLNAGVVGNSFSTIYLLNSSLVVSKNCPVNFLYFNLHSFGISLKQDESTHLDLKILEFYQLTIEKCLRFFDTDVSPPTEK